MKLKNRLNISAYVRVCILDDLAMATLLMTEYIECFIVYLVLKQK